MKKIYDMKHTNKHQNFSCYIKQTSIKKKSSAYSLMHVKIMNTHMNKKINVFLKFK